MGERISHIPLILILPVEGRTTQTSFDWPRGERARNPDGVDFL